MTLRKSYWEQFSFIKPNFCREKATSKNSAPREPTMIGSIGFMVPVDGVAPSSRVYESLVLTLELHRLIDYFRHTIDLGHYGVLHTRTLRDP